MGVHSRNNASQNTNHDSTSAGQEQMNQQSQQQNRGQGQQGQQGFEQPKVSSIDAAFNQNAFIGRRSRQSRAGGRLALAHTAIRDQIVESINNNYVQDGLSVMNMPIDQTRLLLNAVLVYRVYSGNDNKRFVVARTLLVTNPNEKLPVAPTYNAYNGDRLEYNLRPADIANADYWAKTQQHIRQQLGLPNDTNVINAGIMHLPDTFDLESETTVGNLIDDCDVISGMAGETPFSLAHINREQLMFTVTPSISEEQTYTLTGEPVRSDIKMELSARQTRQQNQNGWSNQAPEATRLINRTTGYVDLVPLPQNSFAPQQNQRYFAAQFIITGCTQGNPDDPNTLELFLWSLANMFNVTANQAWIAQMLPRFKEGKDLRSLSALGYWINGEPLAGLDGKDANPMNIVQFLQSVLYSPDQSGQPGLGVLMDIDVVGENSLLQQQFLNVAQGGEVGARATAELNQAADNLTGGAFSKLWNSQTPIASMTGLRISKGTYVNELNEVRDRRDLDFLAVLNGTSGDMTFVNQWLNTFSPNVDANTQLKTRELKERAMIPTEATGYYHRVSINVNWIYALYQAVFNGQLNVAMASTINPIAGQSFTPNGLFTSNMTANQSTLGFAQVNMGNNQNGQFGTGSLFY